jgi:hypothetical protein
MAILSIVSGLALVTGTAFAVHDDGLFELDKDATNDKNHVAVGYLQSNISATATSLNVCEILAAGVTAPAAGETIRIRQETMLVTANAPGSFGGSCSGVKRVYTVNRDGAPANTTQQGGANNVGARISVIRDAALPDGPDWDQVFDAVTADPDTTCAALGLTACQYIEDGLLNTTFTGGSTKDHLAIEGWLWNNNDSPDKAEILNAYAAKAVDDNDTPGDTTDDHQMLYFGMDRQAVDGSTDIGFWFFQSEVFACPDPDAGEACDGVPDGEFAGTNTIGDILILGTFTQGGATSNIRVFEWVGSGGNQGSGTIEGPTGTFGDCVPGQDDDNGCATVNDTTIGVPWDYTFKGESTSGWIPLGGFFEGGIDLTANEIEGCFSTFLAETRSSPEITAVLLDFALGAFESCDATVTTTPSDDDFSDPLSGPAPLLDSNDNDIPDITLGTGDAGANVTDAAIVNVQGVNEWDGTMSFFLCGPIPTSDTCDGSTGHVGVPMGSAVINETTDQPIFSEVANLTEVGYYCWRGEFDSATDGVDDTEDASVGECFEVLPVTPTLVTDSVDAEGNPFSGPVPFGDNVYDRATLTGTADEPGDDGPGDSEGNFTSIDSTNGIEADGTITFTLFVDAGNSCGAQATGTPSTSNPEDVAVSGDGNYFTTGFAPDAPGVYAWSASYDGSTSENTLGATHNTDCTDAAENYTVQQLNPVVATEQTWRPQDEATITVASGAGALDGTVDFELFDNDDCTGTALYDEFDVAITVDGTGLSATAATSNTEFDVSTSDQVWWKVTYDSANDGHTDAFSICVEDTSLTIDNVNPPGP